MVAFSGSPLVPADFEAVFNFIFGMETDQAEFY